MVNVLHTNDVVLFCWGPPPEGVWFFLVCSNGVTYTVLLPAKFSSSALTIIFAFPGDEMTAYAFGVVVVWS